MVSLGMIDLRPSAHRTMSVVSAVSDDQLARPTPCADTSVGDLVDHIGELAVRLREAAAKDTANGSSLPPTGADRDAGWRDRISRDLLALADAWQQPDAWEGMTGAGGQEMSAELVGLVTLDELVVHGWDVAVATGQPYDPEPELDEIEGSMRFFASFDVPRTGAPFGPIVPVAADAPPLDRLLGLTGRDPAWRPPA